MEKSPGNINCWNWITVATGNVPAVMLKDSDGTLIINHGDLDGGTLATQVFAQRLNKPHVDVQLDHGVTAEVVSRVMEWFQRREIKTLNVAGPRESKRPGIYRLTRELLDQIDDAFRRSDSGN